MADAMPPTKLDREINGPAPVNVSTGFAGDQADKSAGFLRHTAPKIPAILLIIFTVGFFAIVAFFHLQPSGNRDAAASSLGKQEEEQAALVRGIDIDYDSFYAEARTTGLKIGQRYRFTAEYLYGDSLYDGSEKSLPASPAFDDQAQYTEFLKGDTRASRTIVASMEENGKIYVHAIE
jgi:hypothetical protein